MTPGTIRLAADALVVLAGPSGAGKSTWAAENFRPSQVVASDDLRAVVGENPADLRASTDAFDVLDLVVQRRLKRGLLTVVDTLGMDEERHAAWQAMAAEHGRASHLVCFDEDDKTYRSRNRSRPGAVPAKVLTAQLARWAEARGTLGTGFDHVHVAGSAIVVPQALLAGGPTRPASLRFGLSISSFEFGDRPIRETLASLCHDAEAAGFDSIWVMDHFVQIPQVGREWDPMLEAYSTLGFLAAHTNTVGLGAMVTCVNHRNIALLGKIVATLDVLSGGRARCGLGVGWFEREQRAYGYRFPPVGERYELLQDALGLLPLLWGPGSPAFEGHHISTPEAICYPRPIQAHIPVLIGGSGEQRTLRLVAQHADACNLFGEPDVVAHKVGILHQHCQEVGRDPAEVEVTQLSSILCAPDRSALAQRLDEMRPAAASPEAFAERTMAATPAEHIDRFGRLAEAGVQTVIVSLADIGHPDAVASFAPVIDALRA